MKKLLSILIISSIPYMISCTLKSKEEVAAQEASYEAEHTVNTEETVTPETIITPEIINPIKERHFLSTDLGLPPGRVDGFAPTDEEIAEWTSPNQEQIYIRIIDVNGKIQIHECDYKVWLNVYKNDIIK